MIQIQNTIVSQDIFDHDFVCNLSVCKGQCCVEGDAGAPLEKAEVLILEEIYPKVKPFLRKEGIEAIESQGTSVIDIDQEDVTPLVNNNECAYVIYDDQNITKCGIEKAFEAGIIEFIKPISCHLYPIRVSVYDEFEGLNYERITICNPACILGEKLKLSVLDFLEAPLKRKYGDKWYAEAQEVQKALKSS